MSYFQSQVISKSPATTVSDNISVDFKVSLVYIAQLRQVLDQHIYYKVLSPKTKLN